jgi:hypothetical protein
MRPRLKWFFVAYFLLSSVAATQAQLSYFSETVAAWSQYSKGCGVESSKKRDISCSDSWQNSYASGYEEGIAQNSYGVMRAHAYVEVYFYQDGSFSSESYANESVNDTLSFVGGLKNQPTAFLKIDIGCGECVKDYFGIVQYSLTAWWDAGHYSGQCTIQKAPRCTVTVPILYDQNGKPLTVQIARVLFAPAVLRVNNAKAGTKVTLTTDVGYKGNGSGAFVEVRVVNAHNRIIKGVTVVGASGHIYN